MKIVLTGAGGGHFYPLIAVAEKIRSEAFIQKILQPEFYFFSDLPHDEEALFSIEAKYIFIPAGKVRLYPSIKNITDVGKTLYGCLVALFRLYSLYPDVVFAKGGYASFPTLFAAKILSIPVVIHESDTVPGRTTLWAGSFASRVAVSYKEAFSFYDKNVTALTGQPIRDALLPEEGFSREYKVSTKEDRKVILIVGGSQGSQRINEVTLSILPTLLSSYDVIHQTGDDNIAAVKESAKTILNDHPFKEHYYPIGFLDMGVFYSKVDLIITRAGSAMFEMIEWQLPFIIIPIPESISRDQRSNAYAMAHLGVASVIEEENLGPNVLMNAIQLIVDKKEEYMHYVEKAKMVPSSRNAARIIAKEILRIALSHS
jgi:UDP-N-acetylglucosamine--N-acetylmuramyl-(pentapeptide) pyrophosphoryl-undecaprenol N-acetylglucosamine transferase